LSTTKEKPASQSSGPENVRTRLLRWEDPMPHVQRGMTMSPLDYLTAMLRGEIPKPPIAELMNTWGVELEPGRAIFAAQPGEEHYNPLGVVHGGFLATLLDTAMSSAIFTSLGPGHLFSTLEIKVNYLRPLRSDSGPVTCEGKAVHVGRTVATGEGRVVNQAGKLVATGTCTCMLFQIPGFNGASGS
jgi:uncharacterized protein (TIGR00369 family)